MWCRRYTVLVVLMLSFGFTQYDRLKTIVLTPYIIQDLNLSYVEAGLCMSAFFIGYTVLMLPSGMLVDKYKWLRKKMLIFSVAFSGVMSVTMIFMRTFNDFFLRNLLFGIGDAFEWMPAAVIIAFWFPRRERAKAYGIYGVGSALLMAVSPLIVRLIISSFGNWRWCFVFTGLWTPLMCLLLWYYVDPTPEDSKKITKEELELILESNSESVADVSTSSIETPKISFTAALKSINIWLAGIAYFLLGFGSVGVSSWLPKYIFDVYGLELAGLTLYLFITYMAGPFGLIVLPIISDRIGRRKPVIVISALVSSCCILAIPYIPAASVVVVSLVLILVYYFFYFGMGAAVLPAYLSEVIGPRVAGTSISLPNTFQQASRMLAPTLLAMAIVTTSTGVSYNTMWLICATCFFVGTLVFLLVKERT